MAAWRDRASKHGGRRWFAVGVGLAVTLALPASVMAQDAPGVSVRDNLFDPSESEISAGDTLNWSHDGAVQHTITADDGSFDSGLINPGDMFAITFDTPGTIPYYCQVHGAPGGIGMAGVIVVN
jgi:plastocyanin